MTIENKTSFQRLRNGKFAMMYLGGFANRDQIEFLKKVISDNPNIKYYHFGDIDIGGFISIYAVKLLRVLKCIVWV